jgi:hypothetical protein
MQKSVQKSDCGICRQSLKWYQRKEDMILYKNIARVHRKCRRTFLRELKRPKSNITKTVDRKIDWTIRLDEGGQGENINLRDVEIFGGVGRPVFDPPAIDRPRQIRTRRVTPQQIVNDPIFDPQFQYPELENISPGDLEEYLEHRRWHEFVDIRSVRTGERIVNVGTIDITGRDNDQVIVFLVIMDGLTRVNHRVLGRAIRWEQRTGTLFIDPVAERLPVGVGFRADLDEPNEDGIRVARNVEFHHVSLNQNLVIQPVGDLTDFTDRVNPQFTEWEVGRVYDITIDGDLPTVMRYEGIRLDFSNDPNMTTILTPEAFIRLEWQRTPERTRMLRKIETTFNFILPMPTDESYPRDFINKITEMFQRNMRHNIMFEHESEFNIGRVFLDNCHILGYSRHVRGGEYYIDMKLRIISTKIRRQFYDR